MTTRGSHSAEAQQPEQSIGSVFIPLTLLCCLAVAACAGLFWHSLLYPTCCDTVGYGMDAEAIQKNGLSRPMWSNGLKTYGYPLFLSVVYAGYDWDPFWGIFSARAAITQTLLYVAACLTLFAVTFPINKTFAWCSFAGLACNPFVLNYVPLRLTESPTATIAVLLVAAAVALSRPSSLARSAATMFGGSLLAGYALMVRPTNLSLLIGWIGFVGWHLWQHPRTRVPLLIIAANGIILPLIPQLAINYFVYGRVGVMPTVDLGSFQIAFGLRTLKWLTVVTGTSGDGLPYPNPFFTPETIGDPGIGSYFRSPLRGLATAAAHIFQSINHDYFFTYVHDRSPWPSMPFNFTSHAMIFAAMITATSGTSKELRGVAVFVLLAIGVTLAINSISAVETRFGLLIYAVSGPLALWGTLHWRRLAPRPKYLLLGATAAYATILMVISFAALPLR